MPDATHENKRVFLMGAQVMHEADERRWNGDMVAASPADRWSIPNSPPVMAAEAAMT
jgi:hypothetical protein